MYRIHLSQLLSGASHLTVVSDRRLRQLCENLRKARNEEEMRRASKALRAYLREQQLTMWERLAPYVGKAFLTLHEKREWSN